MSKARRQDAHIVQRLPELHGSLLEIVGLMNRPERDVAMLAAAGLGSERALFPLLVLIGRLGPIGIVDLASRVGRDHTTVSRQVARMEELDLVSRRDSPTDRRGKEALISARGHAATVAVDRAREQMAVALFADWSRSDFDQLTDLVGKLADDLTVVAGVVLQSKPTGAGPAIPT